MAVDSDCFVDLVAALTLGINCHVIESEVSVDFLRALVELQLN